MYVRSIPYLVIINIIVQEKQILLQQHFLEYVQCYTSLDTICIPQSGIIKHPRARQIPEVPRISNECESGHSAYSAIQDKNPLSSFRVNIKPASLCPRFCQMPL